MTPEPSDDLPRDGPGAAGGSSRGMEGCRVLVVEDEGLLALELKLMLEEAGAQVLGPEPDERGAMRQIDGALAGQGLGAAILDVNLGGHTCERVAARLRELNVPFVLHTGEWRAEGELVEALGAPVVPKPASERAILGALRRVLEGQ